MPPGVFLHPRNHGAPGGVCLHCYRIPRRTRYIYIPYTRYASTDQALLCWTTYEVQAVLDLKLSYCVSYVPGTAVHITNMRLEPDLTCRKEQSFGYDVDSQGNLLALPSPCVMRKGTRQDCAGPCDYTTYDKNWWAGVGAAKFSKGLRKTMFDSDWATKDNRPVRETSLCTAAQIRSGRLYSQTVDVTDHPDYV